jgi:hypothetical protein
MERIFGVSGVVGTLGLGLYVLGVALGPMTLTPLSEYFGSGMIYIISYGMFILYLVTLCIRATTQSNLRLLLDVNSDAARPPSPAVSSAKSVSKILIAVNDISICFSPSGQPSLIARA